MNSAWRKLWPDCVTEREFEGFDAIVSTSTAAPVDEERQEDRQLVDDIVTVGQSLGLEMDSDDIDDLLEEHHVELTTEELLHLQAEQKKTLEEEMSSEEEEGRKDAPSSLIKDVCAKWNELYGFVELYHPDKAVTSRAVNAFNDEVMSHFRKVLKRRQKQVTLDMFFKKRQQHPTAESSKPERFERERSPSADLPEVVMEGDSPSNQ